MTEETRKRILIVDDDPSHLEIYGMIVERAGYEPVTALVRFSGLTPSVESGVSLILLDYRLNCSKTSPEIALELQGRYPKIPIVVLSDVWSLPLDIAPHATGFIRKGDPQQLVKVLNKMLPPGGEA